LHPLAATVAAAAGAPNSPPRSHVAMGGYSGDAHNNGNNALGSSSSFPRFLTTTTELAIMPNTRHQPFLVN